MAKVKLAIVSTHPIQYYAPLFWAFANLGPTDLRVFYPWSQVAEGSIPDKGFGTALKWEFPLPEGYAGLDRMTLVAQASSKVWTTEISAEKISKVVTDQVQQRLGTQ